MFKKIFCRFISKIVSILFFLLIMIKFVKLFFVFCLRLCFLFWMFMLKVSVFGSDCFKFFLIVIIYNMFD